MSHGGVWLQLWEETRWLMAGRPKLYSADELRERKTEKQRKYRARKRPIQEKLNVRCWCFKEIVKVSTRDIRNGITGSCGGDNCNPR